MEKGFVRLVFRKRIEIKLNGLLIFVISAYLLMSPWIVRNMNYGTCGMGEGAGFTLGWTYGHLKSPEPRKGDEKRYDEYIEKYRTDGGTANFLWDEVRTGRDSLSGSSKKVINIIKRKALNNIPSVMEIKK